VRRHVEDVSLHAFIPNSEKHTEIAFVSQAETVH
jgi:hypothetical protein